MRPRLRRFGCRPRTLRHRIVGLTLIPVVALAGLWTFAMVSTTGELRDLLRLQSVYESVGTPVDTAIGQIQIERRLAAAYLGRPKREAQALADLYQQQDRTDEAVRAMREAIQNPERRENLTLEQLAALDAMVWGSERLSKLRERVVDRAIGWDAAITEYSQIVEPGFAVQSALSALTTGQLAREAQVLIELIRVREYVAKEDALVAGARAADRFTSGQFRMLTATIESRRVFQRTYVGALPADSRELFRDFEGGRVYADLVRAEDALVVAGPERADSALRYETVRAVMDTAVKQYMLLCTEAGENLAARGRALAVRELGRAGIAGVLGLAAVGVSLWVSARTGRRIADRLEQLRDAADLLATRQLPDVMRKLGLGERVDAAEAAPPLALGDDEIGQVGDALNTARRAAVDAAVMQATLRRGMFAVLLNIARRSQTVMNRQLGLLGTLERRVADPELREDLARVGRLTTRMRRHAEGLIILSGAAPGRAWRGPVSLGRIVHSAVGEIEHGGRIEIPPLADVAVVAGAATGLSHLLAELLENAVAFSSPGTQVTLRGSEAGGGFVLEIDDRGLGMGQEELVRANAVLSTLGDFDPAQTERLGLYVVGRLAGRHGIRVTLGRSPYGGCTAVVLLPHELLADVEKGAGEGAPAAPTMEPPALPKRQ
jgi:signal transduction histidine kinase